MTEHKEQTDTIKEVNLESSLEQVMWAQKIATPGGKATLQVFTNYVGQGADLKIKLKDYSGKTLDTINAGVVGNHFGVEITVPEKAKDVLFAEVQLSKHGLTRLSEALFLIPFIEISNVGWSAQEARREDLITLSADVSGVPDGTDAELSIWEHSEDGNHTLVTRFPVLVLDKKIEKEWEFQYAGDVLDLATDFDEGGSYVQPAFFFRIRVKGVQVESEELKFFDRLQVIFKEGNSGLPIADHKIKLIKPDGSDQEITLDRNGMFEEDDVLPGRYQFFLENLDLDEEKEALEEKDVIFVHKQVIAVKKQGQTIEGELVSGGGNRVVVRLGVFDFSA